jgi:hypothetical protein
MEREPPPGGKKERKNEGGKEGKTEKGKKARHSLHHGLNIRREYEDEGDNRQEAEDVEGDKDWPGAAGG